ncbi:MAG: hypothetical protein WA152_03225 [Microgenomates group bacterium]
MQESNSIPTPVSTPQVAIEQPKQSNFLTILLSVLLLLSISIAGFFAFQTQKLIKELTMLKTEEKVVYTSEPITEPLATDSSEVDPTANWKTYTDLDKKHTFKYPSDWVLKDDSEYVDLYSDGKIQLQQNIVLSKGEYKITSYNPLAWGPSACIYSDSPVFEGPSTKYDSFVEIKGLSSILRRAKNEYPPEVKKDDLTWSICSKEKTSEFFVTVAWFGGASYTTPINYDESILKTMDQIIGSFKVLN